MSHRHSFWRPAAAVSHAISAAGSAAHTISGPVILADTQDNPGGGANAEMVENGFRIILSDPNVKGILINIFGGILRCDVLAKGVVKAAQKTNINVPVVVRMEGTNIEEGRRILAESGLQLTTAIDLKDAAQKVAEIVQA